MVAENVEMQSLHSLCCKKLMSAMDSSIVYDKRSCFIPHTAFETLLRLSIEQEKFRWFKALVENWPGGKILLRGNENIDKNKVFWVTGSIQSPIVQFDELDVSFCPIGTDGTTSIFNLLVKEIIPLHVKIICDINVDTMNYDLVLKVLKMEPENLVVVSLNVQALRPLETLEILNNIEVKNLLRVDLNMNSLRDSGACLIFPKLVQNQVAVQYLDVSYNVLNSDAGSGCEALKTLLKNSPYLRYLDLTANRMGPFLSGVLSSISAPQLSVLKLSLCGLQPQDLAVLVETSYVAQLRELHIDGNNLRRSFIYVKRLFEVLVSKKSKLEVLNVRDANIAQPEMKEILPDLQKLTMLRHILLDNLNDVYVIGMQMLLPRVMLERQKED